MGEILISFVIGGCLIVSGVIMNVVLDHEAKKWKQEKDLPKG